MQLLDARERLICNWGRADWCSWRRRGGSGGGGRGGGGWPLSNGEGGGGDAAAEVAGLVLPREGAITAPRIIPAEVPGVTFPSSRAVVSVVSGGGGRGGGREKGGVGSVRSRGPARAPAGGGAATSVPRCGAAAQLPAALFPPRTMYSRGLPHGLPTLFSSPRAASSQRLPSGCSPVSQPPVPGFPPFSRSGLAGAAAVLAPRECNEHTKKRAI